MHDFIYQDVPYIVYMMLCRMYIMNSGTYFGLFAAAGPCFASWHPAGLDVLEQQLDEVVVDARVVLATSRRRT